jgi:hypothetical protein
VQIVGRALPVGERVGLSLGMKRPVGHARVGGEARRRRERLLALELLEALLDGGGDRVGRHRFDLSLSSPANGDDRQDSAYAVHGKWAVAPMAPAIDER